MLVLVSVVRDGFPTYNVKLYDFRNYDDFAGTVEEFKRAAVVVGVHGGGLANILFSPQCTTVIELM